MKHLALRMLALVALLTAASTPLSAQTTWHVDLSATPPGDGSQASPYVSIQQALSAVSTVNGDTVLVAPGDYFETLDYGAKALVVRASAGPLQTVLRPASASDPAVVTLGTGSEEPPPVLEGFTVRRDPSLTTLEGVRIPFPKQARLVRCIVTGHGSGVYNNLDLFLEECTVTGNRVGIVDGSGIVIHEIRNSIVRGNSLLNVGVGGFSFTTMSHSDIGGLASVPCDLVCTGNLDADPLFWDAAGGDFHLRPGSPCIDTGIPVSPLDPDGSRIDMGAIPFDPFWAPGTESSCFGDALACPCGNGGSGQGGCEIPQGTGGFVLQVMNFAPNGIGGGTAQFLGTGYPPATAPGSTLIRSPMLETPPVVFGDGLRCIATAGLVRVGATVASGGTSLHALNHGAGAGTFHYQVWVRSNPATFCNPEAFNLSNAVSVTW